MSTSLTGIEEAEHELQEYSGGSKSHLPAGCLCEPLEQE